MANIKDVKIEAGTNLYDAVKLLLKARANGENIKCEFSGYTLYSKNVTMDSAYQLVTGMKKDDYDRCSELIHSMYKGSELSLADERLDNLVDKTVDNFIRQIEQESRKYAQDELDKISKEENNLNEVETQNPKRIVINITRDARNDAVATVSYDSGNGLQGPFEMDEQTKYFACYVARKSVGMKECIVINSNTGEEVFEPSIMDHNIFISGADKSNVSNLILTMDGAASDLDIKVPLYVTNGKETVFYNKEKLAHKNFESWTRDQLEAEDKIQSTVLIDWLGDSKKSNKK